MQHGTTARTRRKETKHLAAGQHLNPNNPMEQGTRICTSPLSAHRQTSMDQWTISRRILQWEKGILQAYL